MAEKIYSFKAFGVELELHKNENFDKESGQIMIKASNGVSSTAVGIVDIKVVGNETLFSQKVKNIQRLPVLAESAFINLPNGDLEEAEDVSPVEVESSEDSSSNEPTTDDDEIVSDVIS